MVGHGHYPSLDGAVPKPASVSRRVITGLLRDELGFEGVVFTDDMEMGAIDRYGDFGQAVVEAITAGADAILVCHSRERIVAAHEALRRAVDDGTLSRERLTESRKRLTRLRA
jgi:beta-N-acetylhexosaminidase